MFISECHKHAVLNLGETFIVLHLTVVSDEDGCIVSPPPVTIVLLTMHGWYVTPKDFLAKVIEMYPTVQLHL